MTCLYKTWNLFIFEGIKSFGRITRKDTTKSLKQKKKFNLTKKNWIIPTIPSEEYY